jgi:carboxymethylenebutenolidase
MKRLSFCLLLAAFGVSAQDWAQQRLMKSPRHGEWVTIKHDGRDVQTFVVYPEVKNKVPVVVVIHEIFGMTDWVQELADEVAAAGYIALAPDLLSGMAPNGGRTKDFAPNAVGEAIRDLKPDQITADLNAVADYGKALPASNGKVMVTGYCWGGSQSFRFATNRADLAAAFVFYGTPPTTPGSNTPDKEALARIKAPVYGFFGENDARVDAFIPPTEAAMKELGKTYEPVIYRGAGHGFMRSGEDPNNKVEGNVTGRTDAWARWKTLLKKGT